MKSQVILGLPCLAAAFLSVSGLLAQPVTGDLPHAVQFELGKSEFAPGDGITILQMRGTSEVIKVGETYSVDGTYELASHDEAALAFYATTIGASGLTPVDPQQHINVKKGSGSFHLVKTMGQDGYLHVSFYPLESGSGFGGVYFGQRDRVLHAWSQAGSAVVAVGSQSGALGILGQSGGAAGEHGCPLHEGRSDQRHPNGRPEGRHHRQKSGDRRLGIPFITGVFCAGSDFAKLKEQIKKLDGYEYSGSIGNSVNQDGSDTCNVFSLVPYHAYPEGSFEQIYHRLGLRQQVFYDQIKERK